MSVIDILKIYDENNSLLLETEDFVVSTVKKSCAIAIHYTDNTTENIYPGYCPDWVKWRSDQDCPENTCKCDCGDHYCCFDAKGNPVLEIPKV